MEVTTELALEKIKEAKLGEVISITEDKFVVFYFSGNDFFYVTYEVSDGKIVRRNVVNNGKAGFPDIETAKRYFINFLPFQWN